jgi:integrase
MHQLVEAPRIYRLAKPPKAVPWSEVQALLASIDRSSFQGIRDYTLLYLIAAYGLRCGEAVNLKLEDIDLAADRSSRRHFAAFSENFPAFREGAPIVFSLLATLRATDPVGRLHDS